MATQSNAIAGGGATSRATGIEHHGINAGDDTILVGLGYASRGSFQIPAAMDGTQVTLRGVIDRELGRLDIATINYAAGEIVVIPDAAFDVMELELEFDVPMTANRVITFFFRG